MSLRYIIDGYNTINHPLYIRTHKRSASPQEALLLFIREKRLSGSPKNKVTIVFDGYPPAQYLPVEREGMNALFSRKISADRKIEMLVEESADRKNIIVVSDDREIKLTSKCQGARSIGVEEFIGPKKKAHEPGKGELAKPVLSYSSIHKINEELSSIWLEKRK